MKLSYEDAISFIEKQQPSFLDRTVDGSGFNCPVCSFGSKSGESGLSFDPQENTYQCPECNRTGGVFQLMADKMKVSLLSSPEVYTSIVNELCKTFDVEIQESLSDFFEKRKTMSDYILRCHDNVYATDYFEKRGIGQDLIDRFFLGYDEMFNDPTSKDYWPAVILPTSDITYEARNLDVEIDAKRDKNKYRKHGNTVIFNNECLESTDETPLFVCSGIFDALSIIECGGEAIALQSSYSFSNLLKEFEKQVPSSPLVLVLSGDLSVKLAEELKKKTIAHIVATDIFGKYNDVNQRLIYDREGLKTDIEKKIKEASSLPDPIEAAREEYLKASAGRSVPDLISQIRKSANDPRITTGFPQIDKVLDKGLYQGLYTLGAISSLGKTTFLLQVADNLARQGQDVLFFSLEQSKSELMCKSISRLTYEYCLENNCPLSYAKTGLGISDGRRWKEYGPDDITVMQKCFNAYQQYADHIFIYEGVGNISVKDIRDKVAMHIGITKNPHPIVMIDYLQVLSVPENERRSTDKQFVDYNITALRQLARDFELTVFCISALNRQSYSDKISMSAFKESGNIEYGSDVLLGLQFHGVEEKDFNLEKAKESNPRDIELCVLKNRNVSPHSEGIRMLYDARFNHFICKDDLLARSQKR